MTRSSLALPSILVLVACGGATNNDTGNEPTGDSRQATSCTLAPGEDVCARLATIPADGRSLIANVTAFAGETRALVLSLEAACNGVLEELDQPVAQAPNAKPRDRAKVACDRAVDVLTGQRPAGAALEIQPPACHPTTVPACVLDAKRETWQTCDAPKIVVNLSPRDGADSGQWVGVVERRTPPIFATVSVVRLLAERTRALTLLIEPVPDLGDCSDATTALMSDAIGEIQTSTEIASNAARVLAE